MSPVAARKKTMTLAEAEIRLNSSIDRLIAIVKARKASSTDVAKLKAENNELEGEFKSLKGEYENLEKSFQNMQVTLKEMSARPKAAKTDGKEPGLSKDKEWRAAGHSHDPETDFLKKELERVHKEYKTMDQSFKLLRTQYNELQQSYENTLDSEEPEPDLWVERSHKGETSPPAPDTSSDTATSSIHELKVDLGNRLDKTISALEKLVG